MNDSPQLDESSAQVTEPTTITPVRMPRKKIKILLVAIGAGAVLIGSITAFVLIRHMGQTTPAPTVQDDTPATVVKTPENLSTAYDTFAESGVKEFTNTQKDAVLQMYSELSSGFVFTTSKNFLDDTATQLHALGIAYLAYLHPEKKTLYRDELYLLAMPYLETLPTGIVDTTFVSAGSSDEATAELLLSYRDNDLSTRVEQAAQFQTALTTAVKALKIADTQHLSSYKIVAYNFTTDDAQFTALTKKYNLYGARPMMWVEGINDTAYIMMMKDYAQDVIDGKKNSLTHEFIHTQQPFVRGETGRVVEERRAEYFSGDTSAYFDAKQAFIYMNVLGNVDGLSLLDTYPTDAGSFFTTIYAQLGVTGGNALAFSWPSAFLGNAAGALRTVADENNLDVVMQQALAVGRRDQTALNSRFQQRFEKLKNTLGSKEKAIQHIESIGEMYALPTAQSEFVRYLKNNGLL